jgi:allantoin racemase
MAEILYLEPASTEFMTGHYQSLLNEAASPGTHVEVKHLPLPGASCAPTFWNAGYELEGEMFKAVNRAGDEGYDAVIIGCSADPGVDVAKRLSRIPVVGPLEAGLHVGAMLSQRMMVITPGPHGAGPCEEIQWLEDRARYYGLRHKIASIRRVDVDAPSPSELAERMSTEPDEVRKVLLSCFERAVAVPGKAAEQILQAIEDEGIGAVYFSCTVWGGMLRPLGEEFHIPMLDPVLCALRVAELLVRSI